MKKKMIGQDRSLERKLNALAAKVARIEAIANFLTKHPGVFKHCTLKETFST